MKNFQEEKRKPKKNIFINEFIRNRKRRSNKNFQEEYENNKRKLFSIINL